MTSLDTNPPVSGRTMHPVSKDISRQPRSKKLIIGEKLEGRIVDFSHGDVDAHEPTPGADAAYAEGYAKGGAQA